MEKSDFDISIPADMSEFRAASGSTREYGVVRSL
jgi:hypothetical protein